MNRMALNSCLSLTLRFNGVAGGGWQLGTVSTVFPGANKTVETVRGPWSPASTPLKRGVNKNQHRVAPVNDMEEE